MELLTFLIELPLWVAGPAMALLMSAVSLAGLMLTRRWILPHLRVQQEDSEFIGTMVQGILVFYGLAVALIAVSVWESYSQTAHAVSEEATTLAALYRDVSTYPEPARSELRGMLREYVHYVIEEAWPLQRKGIVPAGGVARMDRFQAVLAKFEPSTEGQRIQHAETMRAYNTMLHARRARLDEVGKGLPGVMWLVIVIGAGICMVSTYFFHVESGALHGILVALLAVFMSLVIFMILALDQPFRGDLGVAPESFQLIYDQLMKQ